MYNCVEKLVLNLKLPDKQFNEWYFNQIQYGDYILSIPHNGLVISQTLFLALHLFKFKFCLKKNVCVSLICVSV